MDSTSTRRRRRQKPDAEIVLICNPRAGGRWRELATILDSEEARYARRIVTDSVEDIAAALNALGRDAKLVCIYGGDGTIQRALDRLSSDDKDRIHLALLGGGTMNVTSRWCGFSRSPGKNFRYVVSAFRSGDLTFKEVPTLEVAEGGRMHRGFTFGMGPIVRLLDAYERGQKGKLPAIKMAAKAAAATWFRTGRFRELLEEMEAEVKLDGEPLPYGTYSALFANVTGQINPGVEPFVDERRRDSFYCAAYAVSPREIAMNLLLLIRGWMPVDLGAFLAPARLLKGQDLRKPSLPTDPRYVNRTATTLHVRSNEALYTVDGEILSKTGEDITVTLGPTLRLAMGQNQALGQALKIAAGAVKR